MTELFHQLVAHRERAELVARLVAVRDRLGGMGRLYIDEWLELERELPAMAAVLERTQADLALSGELRRALAVAWNAFTTCLRKDIFPPLRARESPSLTLEFRLHEQIQGIVKPMTRIVQTPL